MSAISSGTGDQSHSAQNGVDPFVSSMSSRELNPAERMVDAFERANTMTFTVVAELTLHHLVSGGSSGMLAMRDLGIY